MVKVYCVKCPSNGLYFCRGLTQIRVKEPEKLYVDFCTSCVEVITIQRIESSNPNVKAATRVTIIKPVRRARDSANKELLPKIARKIFN